MNAFRTPAGELDKQYLRLAVCYRLLRKSIIDQPRAIELLAARDVDNPRRLVELWFTGYSFRQLRHKGSA